jgi:hypothetical protein
VVSVGPFTPSFLLHRRHRDLNWGLAAVHIRENWVHDTVARLSAQTEAEWNYVLAREWEKVERHLRAEWENSRL